MYVRGLLWLIGFFLQYLFEDDPYGLKIKEVSIFNAFI